MADRQERHPLSVETWRSALRENDRYYRAVGRLLADHARNVTSVLAGSLRTARLDLPAPTFTRESSKTAPIKPVAGLLLEGPADTVAVGAFVVENHLSKATDATVGSSTFTSVGGHSIAPDVTFEPAQLSLEPGASAVVRVYAVVPADAEPGIAYSGHFAVPDIPGGPIHVRMRRTEHGAEDA